MTVVIALTLSAVTGVAPVAAAQEPTGIPPGTAQNVVPSSGAGVAPTMVVLDASGSMTEVDAGGQSRMDAAKSATTGLVDELGEDAPVGLLTYGTGTGNAPEDKAAGCRDISLLRGPQPGDLAGLTRQVADLTPRGYTPVGQALRTAADALPDDGPRTVVLVSDGIDTCAPPPVCEVAKELKDRGVDLVVNTVGLLVDDAARTELTCIADATGGTYADATDAASLGEEMRRAATRTYSAYTSDIAELPGTAAPAGAPEVPRGDDIGDRTGAAADGVNQVTFRTDLAPATSAGDDGESEQFWRLPVTDGERVTVAVNTTQPPVVDTLNLGEQKIRVHLSPVEDPESGTCGIPLLRDSSDAHPVGVVTADAASAAVGQDSCRTRELLVSVTRGGDWKAGEDVPAEITVTRIGAMADAGDPATGNSGSRPEKMPVPATVRQVTPGLWYDTATELPADGSAAVEATIVPGEQKFFRVPVGYGQTLDTVLTVTDAPEAGKFRIGDELGLGVRNDARQTVSTLGEASSGGDLDVFAKESRWDSFAAPVTFGNRFGGDSGTGGATDTRGSVWLGGDQYLVVTLARSFSDTQIDENSRQVPVTFRLAARATGTATGGPDIAPLTWPEDASATTAAPTGDAAAGASDLASGDGDGGGVPWTVVGIIAVAVVVLGAGGVLVLRRR